MSTQLEQLRQYIRELIKNTLEEASFTGNIDGGEGPPKTPYAFQSKSKRKKDKEKENSIAQASGYNYVQEARTTTRLPRGGAILKKPTHKFILTLPKSVYGGLRMVFNSQKAAEKYVEDHIGSEAWRHARIKKMKVKENVKEGVYHTWKNDPDTNPKQKIGASVREVKNKLVQLEKQVSMNVRLKREMGVNSIDYWKNTHKALKGISERLIKLANRIGQLY
jgi:hypothetical protein